MTKDITVPSYLVSQKNNVAVIIMKLIIETGNVNTVSDELHNYFFVDKTWIWEQDIREFVFVELRRIGFLRKNNPNNTVTFRLFQNYES